MNANNSVKLRRFIVPKTVEQINDHLFMIDTHNSNKINFGTNETTAHDSEMSTRWNNEA